MNHMPISLFDDILMNFFGIQFLIKVVHLIGCHFNCIFYLFEEGRTIIYKQIDLFLSYEILNFYFRIITS